MIEDLSMDFFGTISKQTPLMDTNIPSVSFEDSLEHYVTRKVKRDNLRGTFLKIKFINESS